MKTVLITGGTGFIGQALCSSLLQSSHELYVLTRDSGQAHLLRNENIHYITEFEACQVASLNAVINLAGESLAQGRWTTARKKQLIDSRVQTTQKLVKWLKQGDYKPEVLISGSAVGWYGEHGNESLDEAGVACDDFNHRLCEQWEKAALEAEALGIRVVLLRTGIVLEKGGALAAMLPAFKMGVGGSMGSGKQYWSWIHRKDLIRIIEFIMAYPMITGAVNATAPNPVSQMNFTKALAKALHRPAFLPMPSWLARLLLGEFATEVLLKGQRVIPQKMLDQGFVFEFDNIFRAFEEISIKFK